jgi:signal transduction histidine kinase
MTTSTTVRAMQYGQHAITAVLIVIGTIRAITDGAQPVLVGAGVVIFTAWYAAGSFIPRRADAKRLAVIWLIVLAVLWLGLAIVSVEFIWLAFPLWLLAGHLLPLRPAIAFSFLVFAAVVVVPLVETGTVSYAFLIGPLVGGVFAFGISRGYLQLLTDARERQQLIASLVQAQDDMAGLHEELGRAQRESGAIEERTRLSRDIHDTIAQGFSAIVLITRAGKDRDLPAARTALGQIETIAVDNLVDVRRIVNALAPAELQEGALAGVLRRMLDRLSAETGMHTEMHADASIPALPATVEVALLRTAQSALSNVRLHANATRIVVNLVDAEDSVRLDIVDDGRGFNVESWGRKPEGATSTGYGLHSMRSRLRELGGGLDVESTEGAGTALSAYVPLGPPPVSSPEMPR